MINIDITLDPALGDIKNQLDNYMKTLGYVRATTTLAPVVYNFTPEKNVSPAPKNFDERTTCPTSQTVVEIHSTGSTELNAEPAKDFKMNIEPLIDPHAPKARKARKKSDVVTKEEVVAFAKAAIDPQDLEDEKAHAETSVTLTHDDLRAVVGEFTKVYGIAKAQKMIPVILGCAIVEVPQDKIQEAIDKIRVEISDVEDEPEDNDEGVTFASEADVREAMMAYAKKYDGSDAKMTNTLVDGPKILAREFGDTVTAIRLIPNDPKFYGRALDAINNAINFNPFMREVAL